MTYPLVLDLADDGIPVTVTCRVLGFSTQGFYKWRANPVSDRDWDDAHLIDAIVGIHADDPEFGYRFIADELAAAGHAGPPPCSRTPWMTGCPHGTRQRTTTTKTAPEVLRGVQA
jgi:hypothetical protein